jgi:hypothetical protein
LRVERAGDDPGERVVQVPRVPARGVLTRIGLHNAALDAKIGQLRASIDGDPLFNTFEGHMVVLVGQGAALGTLSSR